MAHSRSPIGTLGIIFVLLIAGTAVGYLFGMSPAATAQTPPAQTCPNAGFCDGGNCPTREACRKTGCGCGCVQQ